VSGNNTVQQIIETKLQQAFSPKELRVVNESHQHNVPDGAESHFKVLIVSDHFDGVRKIQRQQQVYKVLADELAAGVHALTMQTLTAEEWEADNSVSVSPQCMGGS
jgi:BolA protein